MTTCNQMESSANVYFLNGDFANHITQHVNHTDDVDKWIVEHVGNWKWEPANWLNYYFFDKFIIKNVFHTPIEMVNSMNSVSFPAVRNNYKL